MDPTKLLSILEDLMFQLHLNGCMYSEHNIRISLSQPLSHNKGSIQDVLSRDWQGDYIQTASGKIYIDYEWT